MNSRKYTGAVLSALLLTAMLLTGCADKDDDESSDGPNNPSLSTAQISGTVRDGSGAALANAALHVIYSLPGEPAAAQPQDPPTSAILYTTQILRTECGGSIPLPDGVRVKIFWDRDGDGAWNGSQPDDDPQPPLCEDAPECERASNQRVNFNEFPINGSSYVGEAGTFFTERAFFTNGSTLEPNRFYLRIYCSDGQPLYTSDVLTLGSGPQEVNVAFECTPCSGEPPVPAWSLDPVWPNPVIDSVQVRYGLQETASALLTWRSFATNRTDTLVYATRSSGSRTDDFSLRALDYPNGLYELRYSAGTFTSGQNVLKNTSDIATLRDTAPITLSNTDGQFTMNTAAGQLIQRRSPGNQSLGAAPLNTVRVVALRPGFQPADTTLEIQPGREFTVNLTLFPL